MKVCELMKKMVETVGPFEKVKSIMFENDSCLVTMDDGKKYSHNKESAVSYAEFLDYLGAKTKTELKHCPFCTGEAMLFNHSDGTYSVCCTRCSVCTPKRTEQFEVVGIWNTRIEC